MFRLQSRIRSRRLLWYKILLPLQGGGRPDGMNRF
jgi:hypothetical protein